MYEERAVYGEVNLDFQIYRSLNWVENMVGKITIRISRPFACGEESIWHFVDVGQFIEYTVRLCLYLDDL